MIELFQALGLQYIVVLRKGKLVGVVRRLDLVTHLAFYQQLLARQRVHEHEMGKEMENTINNASDRDRQHRRSRIVSDYNSP